MTSDYDFHWGERDDPEVNKRLGEMILYVADKCLGDPTFGAIKLNKILWWSDFLAFGQFGKPVTGAAYRRLERGPAPFQLVPVRDDLVESGDAVVQERHVAGLIQERVVPLRQADLSLFDGEHIELVNQLVRILWAVPASEISEQSHGKAWKTANHRELIPYEAIFLSDQTPTEADRGRAAELAKEHGWT